MITMRDRYITALQCLGYVVIKTTKKYVVMRTDDYTDRLIYVGKAGAVRVGGTVADSIPVTPDFKSRLLKIVPISGIVHERYADRLANARARSICIE